MTPTYEDLEKRIAALQQDLNFARDDANQWQLRYEEAKEGLREKIMLAAVSAGHGMQMTITEDGRHKTQFYPSVVWDVVNGILATRRVFV